MPYVPVMRTVNNQGDGTLFGRTAFRYDPVTDTYLCPGQKDTATQTYKPQRPLHHVQGDFHRLRCMSDLKARCTHATRRGLARHLYEDALNRMQERVTADAMRLRRSTVEHPFATIKSRIFGHPRFLLRGLLGAKTEIGIATMVYNLKRIANVLSWRSQSHATVPTGRITNSHS